MEIFSWGNNIFGQLGFKTSENEDEEEHLLPRGRHTKIILDLLSS